MLYDYKNYLLELRNNLIRCGVGLNPKDITEYDEVFYLGEELEGILWYYSILSISGSSNRLRNFAYPLDSYFNKKVRDKLYDEYIEYKSNYMRISISGALAREQAINGVNNISNDSSSKLFKNSVPAEEDKFDDDDEFIEYDTEGMSDDNDSDDDFIDYSNSEVEDDDPFGENISDDDPFGENISDDDDDFIDYSDESGANGSSEEDDDEFIEWGDVDDNPFNEGGDDETVEDDDPFNEGGDEDEFIEWGTEDDDPFGESIEDDDPFGESVEDDDPFNEGGDDEFVEWGTEDYDPFGESIEDDDPFGEGIEDDDPFGESIEDDDPFGESIEDDDPFGESIEDDDPFGESIEDDDPFGESIEDDDPFGESVEDDDDPFNESTDDDINSIKNGGNIAKSGSSLEVSQGSTVSSGVRPVDKRLKQQQSNDKMAKNISRAGAGILNIGSKFVYNVADKIKNMED